MSRVVFLGCIVLPVFSLLFSVLYGPSWLLLLTYILVSVCIRPDKEASTVARLLVEQKIIKKRQVEQYNRGRRHDSFKLRDLVYVYTPAPLPKGRKRKLASQWKGPYRITDKKDLTAEITNIHNPQDIQTVHMDRLKLAFTQDTEQLTEPIKEFEIRDIINKRMTQNGTEYLVKWKGYTWKHDSWINETDLNAAKLIEEYEQRSQNEEITSNNNNNNDNKTQTITTKRKRKILWNNLGEGGVVTGAKLIIKPLK